MRQDIVSGGLADWIASGRLYLSVLGLSLIIYQNTNVHTRTWVHYLRYILSTNMKAASPS